MKVCLRRLAVLAVFALLIGATAPNAHAFLTLQLSYQVCTPTCSTTTITVNDGSALDQSAATDVVQYAGVINGWNLTVDSAVSIHPGVGEILDLNVQYAGKTGSLGNALTIAASDDNFIPQAVAFDEIFSAQVPSGVKLGAAGSGGITNVKFASSPSLGSTTFNPPGGFFTNHVAFNSGIPYAATITSTLTSTNTSTRATGSYDFALSAVVPEPAAVTLLGGVLLLTAGAIRRKARRS